MTTTSATAPSMASLNAAAELLWPTLQATWANHQGHPPTNHPAGLSIEVVASLDSSNTELMRRARAGQTDPVLLVAVAQSAGRGRMGKAWVSQPEHSLTFSLGLPLSPAKWTGLSLAVGVSLAESLAALLPPAQQAALALKWPNDLWLRGAKLGGILVETAHAGSHPYVVVGVGINVTPPEAVDMGLAAVPSPGWTGVAPTGMAVHSPQLGVAAIWQAVAPPLLNDLLAFELLGFSAFAQRFAKRDALHGEPLVLSDGQQGVGCGVDEDGALLVHTAQGMRTINSNEVSVRPDPPQPTATGSPPC